MADEIGYQAGGLLTWGAMLAEAHEPNPDLAWPKSIDVLDRMRTEDAQIGSVLRAVTLPIIRADWEIDPAGADPDVVAHIAADLGLRVKGEELVAPLRTRGRFSFMEHLRLALLELVFGHSFFEQVYQVDAFGLAHLAKLAWRPPRTISDVKVAADGGLVSITQYGTTGKTDVTIPVDRLVAYVNEREGANWLGRSLLRTAYKNWLLKDRLLRIQALTAERNGLGIPTFEGAPAPEGAEPDQIQAWHADQIEQGLKLAKNSRAGDTAGAAYANGASLTFQGVVGKLPDTDPMIRYHDEQIARAVLAHFLNLGTETGSWALGSTFANFFTDSLNAVAQHIADVIQQHVIEDLVDLNWGPTARAPRIVPTQIGAEHPATADAIKTLIDAGAITVSEKDEAHFRALYGLPAAGARLVAAGVPEDVARAATDTTEPMSDAEVARFAAETVQKIYLGVGTVIDQDEARAIVQRAGGQLKSLKSAPNPPEEGT